MRKKGIIIFVFSILLVLGLVVSVLGLGASGGTGAGACSNPDHEDSSWRYFCESSETYKVCKKESSSWSPINTVLELSKVITDTPNHPLISICQNIGLPGSLSNSLSISKNSEGGKEIDKVWLELRAKLQAKGGSPPTGCYDPGTLSFVDCNKLNPPEVSRGVGGVSGSSADFLIGKAIDEISGMPDSVKQFLKQKAKGTKEEFQNAITESRYLIPDTVADNLITLFENTNAAKVSFSTAEVSGANIIGNGQKLRQETLTALRKAANGFDFEINGKKVKLRVTSGYRSPEEQLNLFYENCIKNGPKLCNPGTSNPLKDNKYIVKQPSKIYTLVSNLKNQYNNKQLFMDLLKPLLRVKEDEIVSPHLSGFAVDVWCDDNGANFQHNPICQAELGEAMISAGFCRLSTEPWHFELDTNKISKTSCMKNYGLKYSKGNSEWVENPTEAGNCIKWDYVNHECISPG